MTTIKDLKDAVRAVIDTYEIGVEFSATDVALIRQITKAPVKRIKRKINPTFPSDTRHIHAVFTGDEWIPFSWVKAISGTGDEVARTMRFVIKQDMDDYRDRAKDHCALCDATTTLAVDHKDTPFSAIKSEFIAMHGVPELRDWSVGAPKIFKDFELEARWIKYHASRATYQILCKSCNSKKGTK
jgi:hypothetical protein